MTQSKKKKKKRDVSVNRPDSQGKPTNGEGEKNRPGLLVGLIGKKMDKHKGCGVEEGDRESGNSSKVLNRSSNMKIGHENHKNQNGRVVGRSGQIGYAEHLVSSSDSKTLGDEDTLLDYEYEGTSEDDSSKMEFVDVVMRKGMTESKQTLSSRSKTVCAQQVFDEMPELSLKAKTRREVNSYDETRDMGVVGKNVRLVNKQLGKIPASDDHARKVFEEMPQPVLKSQTPCKDLFSKNRSLGNDTKLDVSEEVSRKKADEVKLNIEVSEDVNSTWGHAIIGYIAGKNLEKRVIIAYCKNWNVKHRIYFDASGWIVVKFESEEDRDVVLEEGPYIIFGRPFIIKTMPHLFSFDDDKIGIVPLWIRLPHLPLELWNERALSKIVSTIGTPLQTDNITLTRERVSFARVLVEVDVAKELQYTIGVTLPNGKTFDQKVVYDYVPSYCKLCKAIGHTNERCNSRRGQVGAGGTAGMDIATAQSAAVVGLHLSSVVDGHQAAGPGPSSHLGEASSCADGPSSQGDAGLSGAAVEPGLLRAAAHGLPSNTSNQTMAVKPVLTRHPGADGPVLSRMEDGDEVGEIWTTEVKN